MSIIQILFGTETGNSESASNHLAAALRHAGYHAKVTELAAFPPAELASVRLLLVITSTYGSGDAPTNAEKMLKHLETHPPLLGLRFGVCALGDSTYPNFAQCGRNYDQALEASGAERVIETCICDVDYEKYFSAYQERVLSWLAVHGSEFSGYVPPAPKKGFFAKLRGLFGGGGSADASDAASLPRVSPPSGTKPVPARVLGRRRLNGEGSAKETWHYELEVEDPTFSYEPGDCLAVHPVNSAADIGRFLEQTGFDGTEAVLFGDAKSTLGKVLETRDLQRLTAEFAELLARGRGPLAAPNVDTSAYRKERHLLEALIEHEGYAPLGLAEVLEALTPIAPRLYSIASTPRAGKNIVHLTVETPRYQVASYQRVGLASGYLAERVADGARILVHWVKGAHFRNAPPEADVIWIGPGTGVAPYRAFLAERMLDRGAGRSWLFFGHQHEATDFLYREEWLAAEAAGVLTHLDCAWSRDQAEKRYVQHLMEEKGAEVWSWIERGAVLYVCGDKQHMAADVHRALARIAVQHGGLDEAGAEARLSELTSAGRYRVDVY